MDRVGTKCREVARAGGMRGVGDEGGARGDERANRAQGGRDVGGGVGKVRKPRVGGIAREGGSERLLLPGPGGGTSGHGCEYARRDGDAPAGFTSDRDCELKAAGEEKAAVRYVRHPLEGDEVKAHLASGKLPTRLALTWDDRISFIISEKLEIKRLTFLDLLKEEAEKSAEHADEQFDADFALMAGELSRFLPQIVEALGGEVADRRREQRHRRGDVERRPAVLQQPTGGPLDQSATGEQHPGLRFGRDPVVERFDRGLIQQGFITFSN